MAWALSLPDYIKLADVCLRGSIGNIDSIGNSKLSGGKSGIGESGKEFKNGVALTPARLNVVQAGPAPRHGVARGAQGRKVLSKYNRDNLRI